MAHKHGGAGAGVGVVWETHSIESIPKEVQTWIH